MDPLLGACSLEALRRRTSEKWATHPPDVLPAFIAEMDFDVAEPVRDAVARSVAASDLGYPDRSGLGDTFSVFAAELWDWKVDPSRVHGVPDVMTGVATALLAFTPHGSGVVVNTPVYPPFLFRTEQSGRRLVPVPLRHDGIDEEALSRALSDTGVSAYLLCSPHNPLGRVWTRHELLKVAEMCEERDVLLLVDEIHAPLTLGGASFVPFLSLDHAMVERTVVFHSATKAFNLAGLKCGLLVAGSGEMSDAMTARWETLFPSQLGLVASRVAFTDPACTGWLRAAVGQLEENRYVLAERLAEELPDIDFEPPQASYLAWLDCRRLGLGDDPSRAFLERGRVALSPGPDFGEPGRGHARLNIGTSPELIAEIVRRMARAHPIR